MPAALSFAGSGHLHFISESNIIRLERIFAYMTSEGWTLPVWLLALEQAAAATTCLVVNVQTVKEDHK